MCVSHDSLPSTLIKVASSQAAWSGLSYNEVVVVCLVDRPPQFYCKAA